MAMHLSVVLVSLFTVVLLLLLGGTSSLASSRGQHDLDARGNGIFSPLDARGSSILSPLDARGSSIFSPLDARGSSILSPLDARGSSILSPLDARGSSILSPLDARGSSILSPLLKALSEHSGGSWRDVKPRMKPESRYVKYMTQLYKMSSGEERSLDNLYNTARLIRPRDECLEHNKEFFMQDLSYNLDRVRDKEQLLKSVLLYSFHRDPSASGASACYLNVQEQEPSDRQCQPCAGGDQHTVNFTVRTEAGRRRKWVEVDVTAFLHPLMELQRKHIHLLVNLTCEEDQGLTLRSPLLLLYLNDGSKLARQRWPPSAAAATHPKPTAEVNAIDDGQTEFKLEQKMGLKRRRRRDIHLNNLLPYSEFPTSDCALYDFRVRFNQLKLDHWIIFPPKFNPRYCRGTCPRALSMYGSPVHTVVQNIIYETLDSTVPRPSCVPSHYNPLSVMMFEGDGSYVYKEFEDMIATRCTCR